MSHADISTRAARRGAPSDLTTRAARRGAPSDLTTRAARHGAPSDLTTRAARHGAPSDLTTRAARHGALSDPIRLAIVDQLWSSDRSPTELRRLLGVESNLLAHHLDALERVGLIERSRSSGDGRRRYVHLHTPPLVELVPDRRERPHDPLFVCTRNSARSQLAAALWNSATGDTAESAGTHPAEAIAPGAVAAAARAGISLRTTTPRAITDVSRTPSLVITVCDQAHEEMEPPLDWLHWSIPDPVAVGTDEAFDATVAELTARISGLT